MTATELLQTKLQRPRVPRRLVPRPRLYERLDQGAQGPLTVVCAGAGYGKTTLVSAWIESLAQPGILPKPDPAEARVSAITSSATTRMPVAWVSLDERDSDVSLFLRYVVAALQTMFPGVCSTSSGLLRAPRQPKLDQLSTTLINEIAALPQDFILVIDDFHRLTGTAAPEMFAEFERHWPQLFHLVLISRYMPPLSLPRWRAQGQLIEIRARDLRFTPDEAVTYLEQALPRPLSRESIELLDHRTEGWISGIQLAGMLLQDAEDPEAMLAGLSGQHMAFAEYLTIEVLAQQPPAIRSFLLRTAILELFSAALCEAVFPADDPEWNARKCVDWIEQHSLFVNSLGSQGDWRQYHQMFRAVLMERAVDELGVDQVADLRCGAAHWFASQGLVDEAVRHALAAGDRELAAAFVAQGLCSALNREDRPTLERWLGLFSDEFIQSRPDLLAVQGYSLLFSWQLRPLAKVRQRAEELLAGEGGMASPVGERGVLRGLLAALSALVAYFGNDPNGAVAHCRTALALLPEAWSYVRGGSVLFHAMAMQASGQYAAVARSLIEDYERPSDRAAVFTLRLLQAQCVVQYRQADDLDQVCRTGERLAELAERSRLSVLGSWGYHYAGLAHYQRNELAAAEQSLGRLLELRYTGNLGALRNGVQCLALLHELAGRRPEAWSMVQFLSQLDLEQTGREADETRALRARLWLMEGDLDAASRWADEHTAPVSNEPWPWQDPPQWMKARVLLARGTASDVQDALAILAALDAVAERSFNIRLRIEVLALQSLALDAAGKGRDARDALLTAVNLAWLGGFVRPFLDLGRPMQVALSGLAKEDVHARVRVRHILAEFERCSGSAAPGAHEALGAANVTQLDAASRGHSSSQPLVEPLSRRELEILMLLRDPMTLKEIARQLSISYQTAKRHTVNIYGKLGVNKRWDAVAKAQDLDIIPRR